jgi:transcriptional regulator
MYLPNHFSAPSQAAINQLVTDSPLASLIVLSADSEQPWTVDPVPLMCDGAVAAGSSLWGHVARANPLWQSAGRAMAVFTGPRAYVSPNAYAAKQQHHRVVPTYNYATVQAFGLMQAHHDPLLIREVVERLTNAFERSQPKPWSVSDAPADYLEKMIAAIVVVELKITHLQAKWKVSQNRSTADQEGVLRDLSQRQTVGEDGAIAEIIRHNLQAKPTE